MVVRVKKDLLGKAVIDSKGKSIGSIVDVEVDLKSMIIDSIVVSITATRKEAETGFKKLFSKVKKKTELVIPVSYVQAVSDYVILKIALEDLLVKGEK